MKQFEKYLDICIVTYNRGRFLDSTISKLINSPFRNCKLIVLDNCSNDDTPEIAKKYDDEIEYHRNRINIGGNANILRALEYGDKPYLWVLGDDDDYDFEYTDDVCDILKTGKVDLIHVGAHTDVEWKYGGHIVNTRDISEKGYQYFRFSSFIGCNIIKRTEAEKFIIDGYRNIGNSYPHMPFLLSIYEKNKPIYISERQIVKAVIGNQRYSNDSLLKWWAETSKLLTDINDKRKCFFQQFGNRNRIKLSISWTYMYHKNQISKSSYASISGIFTRKERIIGYISYPLYSIYVMGRNIIKNIAIHR